MNDPILSSFNCGSLSLVGNLMEDATDAHKFVSFVADCAESHSVREFVLCNNRLSILTASQFDGLLISISYMNHLSIVHLQSCGLQSHKLQELIFSVLNLPTIRGTAFEYQIGLDSSSLIKQTKRTRATAAVNLKNNGIADTFVRDIAMMKNERFKKAPLTGVEKLVLSDNPISDKVFSYLVIIFPALKELHLSNCSQITGATIKDILLHYFPKLELLNLDGTLLCHDALLGLCKVMKERKRSESSPPLEVWLRGVGIVDESWQPLLEFCDSKAARSKFTIRHDLQRCLGEKIPRIEHFHEAINVDVYVSGFRPLRLVDNDVRATTSTVRFVNLVIDDLNMMSLLDAAPFSNVKVRQRYRDSFQNLFDGGKLRMRHFVAESAFMYKTNIYDNSVVEVDAMEDTHKNSALIGPPIPGVSVSFDITVREFEEKICQLTVR